MIKADTIIVLPAHNEQEAIGKVITDVQKCAPNCEILVSASGCTDLTAAVAKEYGAQVLPDAPKGKGRAVSYAFQNLEAQRVVMLDADATYPSNHIRIMLDMLDSGWEAVYGIRDLAVQSALNRWGDHFITRQAQLLYGFPIHDLCTGMWAFRGNVVKSLNIQSYGFTLEAEIFTKVVRNHYKLGHISIPYYPRIGDKKINRWDHLRIMAYLWRHSFD